MNGFMHYEFLVLIDINHDHHNSDECANFLFVL